MTWRIFKWDIVEWEKQDVEKHIIYDPTSIKKHIKHYDIVPMHVYYILKKIIWRIDKMCRKDACDAVLEATWEGERLLWKEGRGWAKKKEKLTVKEHFIILKLCIWTKLCTCGYIELKHILFKMLDLKYFKEKDEHTNKKYFPSLVIKEIKGKIMIIISPYKCRKDW